jgi:hypothetical protein
MLNQTYPLIEVKTVSVRAPVANGVSHPFQHDFFDAHGRRKSDDSGNTAHTSFKPPLNILLRYYL